VEKQPPVDLAMAKSDPVTLINWTLKGMPRSDIEDAEDFAGNSSSDDDCHVGTSNHFAPRRAGKGMTSKDTLDARFGRGEFAGRTGDPFIDDPFFNPWAPGGSFNR
jgi:hypothetical protein